MYKAKDSLFQNRGKQSSSVLLNSIEFRSLQEDLTNISKFKNRKKITIIDEKNNSNNNN